MELTESRNIVKTLAQGVHPATGEVFPPESPYNDPKVIRALFSILDFVKHANKPKKSLEERRQENIDCGRPINAGLPWTEEDRTDVAAQFKRGKTIQELARAHDRSFGAIHAELIKQGLVSPDFQ